MSRGPQRTRAGGNRNGAAERLPTSSSGRPPDGWPLTSVLIVDDRAADRELLVVALRDAGYLALEAATGEFGVELAALHDPDLIIAEMLMPTMDGYELVRALRNDPRTAQTPVMFSTATYALEEVRRLAKACGVSHILTKPTEADEIIRGVGEALASAREGPMPLADEEFHREHLRVLNAKLVQKLSELESAERRSAEALTLLETLQSTAPVGFGFVDRDCRIRQINETLAAITGAPVAAQLGRRVPDLVPEIWPQIEPVHRQVLETGEAVLNQRLILATVPAPDDARVCLASYYPVCLNDEIIGIGIVVIDITEREHAEEFRSVVLDNMAEGVYVLDRDDRLVLVNAAASEMLGWTEDELRDKPVHPTIHPEHADGSAFPEGDCALLNAHRGGTTIRALDDKFTRKDGSTLPVSYSAAPLLDGTTVRGTVVVFRDATDEMAERDRVRRELDALTWVGHIRDALDEGRLILYSQPILPLRGGQPREELLLRMIGRNDEIIPPGAFLPTAERYGLIGEIDRWVIGQAVRLAADGRRVQLNVSAESVADRHLLSQIEWQLREAAADPSKLVFEITETALMRNIDDGEAFASRLSDIGCGVALDDFGTGFGSLSHLKSLPIQYLKIDVDFVRELIGDPANQHVVKAIVSLARGFDQQTIAEGVEHPETLELLRDYGVDYAQGYHIGHPAPSVAPSFAGAPPVRSPGAITTEAAWSRSH